MIDALQNFTAAFSEPIDFSWKFDYKNIEFPLDILFGVYLFSSAVANGYSGFLGLGVGYYSGMVGYLIATIFYALCLVQKNLNRSAARILGRYDAITDAMQRLIDRQSVQIAQMAKIVNSRKK